MDLTYPVVALLSAVRLSMFQKGHILKEFDFNLSKMSTFIKKGNYSRKQANRGSFFIEIGLEVSKKTGKLHFLMIAADTFDFEEHSSRVYRSCCSESLCKVAESHHQRTNNFDLLSKLEHGGT